MGAAAQSTPPPDDPVPWETYLAAAVAIKNEPATPPDEVARSATACPAGEWSATHKRWMARMMTDWQLGAAYGQAMSWALDARGPSPPSGCAANAFLTGEVIRASLA
jgi:hypothetical protein